MVITLLNFKILTNLNFSILKNLGSVDIKLRKIIFPP
jgi:hypothetical protein